jgi:hypothetical protein
VRFPDRREPTHGSNACVRRVAEDGHPGLARSTDCAAQCCEKNFSGFCPRRFGSCLAAVQPGHSCPVVRRRAAHPAAPKKPVICQSMANAARRIRRALFFTLREAHSDPGRPCNAGAAYHVNGNKRRTMSATANGHIARASTRHTNPSTGDRRMPVGSHEGPVPGVFQGVKNRTFFPQPPRTDLRRLEKRLLLTHRSARTSARDSCGRS